MDSNAHGVDATLFCGSLLRFVRWFAGPFTLCEVALNHNKCTSDDMNDLSCLLSCPSSESRHEAVKKYMHSPRFTVGKTGTNLEPCSSPCLPDIGGFGRCECLSVLDM